MDNKKHIPGPWRVQAKGFSFIVEEHTHTESISVDANGEECIWSEYNEATACLIASAPEMLIALRDLVNLVDSFDKSDKLIELKKARAVLEQATGKKKQNFLEGWDD